VIHFRDQRFNQALAKEASHTQSHATIDLSSASDRLSLWVVERAFRRNPDMIRALHSCRTRWVVNTIDRKSPRFHRLRKFACMGSACTFPVQSYVFAMIAIASLLHSRGDVVSQRNIRRASQEVLVFGDDMIVPTDSADTLQGLLDYLGLKVNRNKTFVTGRFRESCGVDAYDGHDVTPTYSNAIPDVSRPESIVSCVETHNNFFSRGYYHVADYVRKTVLKVRKFNLPFKADGSGAFGWSSFTPWDTSHLRRRWNALLHRLEYQVDSLRNKSVRSIPETNAVLLQFFTEAQPVTFIEGDRLGVAQRASRSITRRWVSADLIYTSAF
jgi:hypothetical protein